jgi:hypothetical protein
VLENWLINMCWPALWILPVAQVEAEVDAGLRISFQKEPMEFSFVFLWAGFGNYYVRWCSAVSFSNAFSISDFGLG